MTKIHDNGIERDMTVAEQAEHDAKEAAYVIERPTIKLEKIKAIRLNKLIDTDYLANSDVVMTDAMKTYRQGMRDIPQNYTTEEEYDLILARDEDGALTHSVWNKP